VGLLEELCTDLPEMADAAIRRHIWAGKPDSLREARP